MKWFTLTIKFFFCAITAFLFISTNSFANDNSGDTIVLLKKHTCLYDRKTEKGISILLYKHTKDKSYFVNICDNVKNGDIECSPSDNYTGTKVDGEISNIGFQNIIYELMKNHLVLNTYGAPEYDDIINNKFFLQGLEEQRLEIKNEITADIAVKTAATVKPSGGKHNSASSAKKKA